MAIPSSFNNRVVAELESIAEIRQFASDHNTNVQAKSFDQKRFYLRCRRFTPYGEHCPFRYILLKEVDVWNVYTGGSHEHIKRAVKKEVFQIS